MVKYAKLFNSLIEGLRSRGVEVELDATEPLVLWAGGDELSPFALVALGRAPYPSKLPDFDTVYSELSEYGSPLLFAPKISGPLRARLVELGWSWADGAGNFDLRAPGLLLSHTGERPRTTRKKTLPGGRGNRSVLRWLIANSAKISMSRLAEIAGLSAPAISILIRRLDQLGLFVRHGRNSWSVDRAALLARFSDEYDGVGGAQRYFYTLDPLVRAATRLSADNPSLVVSADVGPDLVAPWRDPTHLVVYLPPHVDIVTDLVDARGRADGNVCVRWPHDVSVFPLSPRVVSFRGRKLRLADPVQMYLDLLELGGEDRLDAAGELEQWLL